MIRSWCERVGLLGVLAALAWVAALVVQHQAKLPVLYDWAFPYRVFWFDGLASTGFPCAALAVTLLGWFSTRAPLSLRRVITPSEGRWLFGMAMFALMLAALDSRVFEQHTVWDSLAAGILFSFAGFQATKTPKASLLRFGGSVVYGSVLYSAVCFFYTVVKSTTFLHAWPRDASLIALETKLFGTPPHRWVAAFAATRPELVAWCDWIYFRLFHHMLLTGLLLVARRDSKERIEYLAALSLCYLIGAPLYHLWPAIGPAYFEPDRFAYLNDRHLMTGSVHAWLWQNTQDVVNRNARELYTWSYVACLPSLHVAHEVVMAFYSRRPWPALVASIAFTLSTLVAVVVLGWHYPIDWLAGALLGVFCIFLARKWRTLLWPTKLYRAFKSEARLPSPATPRAAAE